MPEILVVGAGPVGLMLAGELRLAGVEVTVVDRLAEPMTESRATQLNTRTAELLHERGLTSLLAEAVHEPRAHFAGMEIDLSGVDSEFRGNWKVPQYRTEAVLTEWALGLGATLQREYELTGLTQRDGQVECSFAGRPSLRADFVVGCDGQDSTVRQLAGFEFAFVPATRQLLRADATGLDIPDRRFERFEHGMAVASTRQGVTRVMVHEYGSEITRETPTYTTISQVWEKVTGTDISHGRPLWVDAFDNARGHVTRYRNGRVFLAGDAAHRHMPIGGQSLNVGLQDAVSLGRRFLPGQTLDGYHDERHPVGAKTLCYVVAQEDLLLGGHEMEPIRSVLTELVALPHVQAHLADLLSGIHQMRSSA